MAVRPLSVVGMGLQVGVAKAEERLKQQREAQKAAEAAAEAGVGMEPGAAACILWRDVWVTKRMA